MASSFALSHSRSIGSNFSSRDEAPSGSDEAVGSVVAEVDETGASPHPQSYVSSSLAQSKFGFPSRAFTSLCTEHSLESKQNLAWAFLSYVDRLHTTNWQRADPKSVSCFMSIMTNSQLCNDDGDKKSY